MSWGAEAHAAISLSLILVGSAALLGAFLHFEYCTPVYRRRVNLNVGAGFIVGDIVEGDLGRFVYCAVGGIVGLPIDERRKSILVASLLIGSGLNLAIISWFLRREPNTIGVVIGVWLVVYGLIAFGIGFLPARMRLENKPPLIQYSPLLVALVFQLPGFILPPFPLPWRKYIWLGGLLLVFLPWLWPNQRQDIRDSKLSY